MISYVKFQRGTKEAYQALKDAHGINKNTLYFIYPEEGKTFGSLYLGDKLISSGEDILSNIALGDMTDIKLENLQDGDILINENGKWINKPKENVFKPYIVSSNPEIFNVNADGRLDLQAIPSKFLYPTLGNFEQLDGTITDSILELQNTLTWNKINT